MNTLHFRYAVEIEKTRSITQAAENLYMAQPNLSKAIKELENTLGITIFKRTSKGVIPTEQGMKFLECAKQVLIQIDNMEAIQTPAKAKRQKIRVSAPRTSYISKAFAGFVADFDKSYDIDAYLHETSSMNAINDIRENGYDFAIIRLRKIHEKYYMDYLAEKSLDCQLMWEFEKLAVMSSQHSMAEDESITYDAISSVSTEIIQGDSNIPYLSASNILISDEPSSTLSARRRVSVFDRGSHFDILSTVKQSFMLDSPIPKEMLDRFGLVQRKCGFPDNHYCDMLVYPSGHKLTEYEISFVNKVYETRNEVAFGEYL